MYVKRTKHGNGIKVQYFGVVKGVGVDRRADDISQPRVQMTSMAEADGGKENDNRHYGDRLEQSRKIKRHKYFEKGKRDRN